MNTKKFIKKLLFLIVILALCDFALGHALEYFYFRQINGRLFGITRTLETQTAEIVIMGSSRAEYHYNPEIITKKLQMPCYNAGQISQGVLYDHAVLQVILERYTPKAVIVDIASTEFEYSEESYDKLTALNPYVGKHPVLWETLTLRSKTERFKHLSSIYPYNSMFARIAAGNLKLKTRDSTETGFIALDNIWKQPIRMVSFTGSAKIDPNKVEAFKAIQQLCAHNGIKLFVCASPTFMKAEGTPASIKIAKDLCASAGIPFFDDLQNSTFIHNELFNDVAHLNSTGANLYSQQLAEKIKGWMN